MQNVLRAYAKQTIADAATQKPSGGEGTQGIGEVKKKEALVV